MDWHEHIYYETPDRTHLVQRRFYITGLKWSWLVCGDKRKMILTDNLGDLRVRAAMPQYERVLSEARKGPNQNDPWVVNFPAESGREPCVAGAVDPAIHWMATALHFEPDIDEHTGNYYAPETVAERVYLPWPDKRAEYRTEEAYFAALEQHQAKITEAGDALSKHFGFDELFKLPRESSAHFKNSKQL